jgi:MFS family permease
LSVRTLHVLATVARNRELRRVELAFAAFNAAEWGVWIAMLVYAYGQGGATTAGLVALAQLVPAAVFAPVGAALADRRGPGRVLALGYVAQAVAMAATAVALFAGAPPLLAYALAAVAATAVTITRPAQSALAPSLARSPEELTATNVVSGWIESLGVLAAPAAAGLILALSGPGTVFAVFAGVAAAAALLVAPLEGPAPAGGEGESVAAELTAGARLLAGAPETRAIAGLLGAQYVVIGALDILFVVLAIGVLDLGGPSAGYLNAAFGAGGVLGLVATTALVGRPRLAGALALGVVVWSASLALIGIHPTTLGAFLLLAAAGVGRNLFDVAGRTLLQRSAPPEILARVFGVLESLAMVGLAAGALLAPALVALGGARLAFIVAGLLLPVVLGFQGRAFLRADRRANVPVVEIALLRSLPLFAPLPPPELESVARALVPVAVSSGEAVVELGDQADRFYVIADGELEVEDVGRTLRRGDVFGEIALIADTSRTATVRARTDARLLALDRRSFLLTVTGNERVAAEADRLVHERLATARMAT